MTRVSQCPISLRSEHTVLGSKKSLGTAKRNAYKVLVTRHEELELFGLRLEDSNEMGVTEIFVRI
jgi:hypothetical protein